MKQRVEKKRWKWRRDPKGLLEVVSSSFNNSFISRVLSKAYSKSENGRYSPKPEIAPIPPRKESE